MIDVRGRATRNGEETEQAASVGEGSQEAQAASSKQQAQAARNMEEG